MKLTEKMIKQPQTRAAVSAAVFALCHFNPTSTWAGNLLTMLGVFVPGLALAYTYMLWQEGSNKGFIAVALTHVWLNVLVTVAELGFL